MVRVTNYKKNIFLEWWDAFQKSRPAQLTVFVLVLASALTWYFWAKHAAIVEAQQKVDQKQLAANTSAAEQKAREISSITSLFHFVRTPSGKQSVVVAVNIENAPENIREDLATGIQTLLSTKYPAAVVLSNVALPDFYRAGYFDRAFAGDLGFLDIAQFFQHEDILVLIQPHVEVKDTTTVADMKSCNISLVCRAYTSTQESPREVQLKAVGAGFSDQTSLRAAFESLQKSDQANSLLAP